LLRPSRSPLWDRPRVERNRPPGLPGQRASRRATLAGPHAATGVANPRAPTAIALTAAAFPRAFATSLRVSPRATCGSPPWPRG
jgi:hypothetical protein